MLDLAREAGLNMEHFMRYFNNGEARAAILEDGRLGRELYNVRGTPTIMLSDGTKLRHPMAYAKIHDGKILSVGRLPCCGEGCYKAIRELFEKAHSARAERKYPGAMMRSASWKDNHQKGYGFRTWNNA